MSEVDDRRFYPLAENSFRIMMNVWTQQSHTHDMQFFFSIEWTEMNLHLEFGREDTSFLKLYFMIRFIQHFRLGFIYGCMFVCKIY